MAEVSVRNVRLSYGKIQALKDVSLEVEEGSLFGIIGPDGAGKTSLFRIMTTLIVPDSGSAHVCGYDTVKDMMEIRRLVGYMPGHFSLYQDLTVEENLSLFASVFNTTVQENYSLVEDIYRQIEPFRKRRAGKLSGGMKQKLTLCCAMIHRPRVLFLDEPTTGVDPVSRKEFWQMLSRLKAQGMTIIVSTPYMDEASLCDTVSLMKDGRFFKTDSPGAITEKFGKHLFEIKTVGSTVKALDGLAAIDGVQACYPFGDRLHIVSPSMSLAGLSERAASAGYDISTLAECTPTVEDCFMDFDNNDYE